MCYSLVAEDVAAAVDDHSDPVAEASVVDVVAPVFEEPHIVVATMMVGLAEASPIPIVHQTRSSINSERAVA